MLWQARTTKIKIGIFQKCKVHLCILKGFKTAAHQIWHILRIVRESNPGQRNWLDSQTTRRMCQLWWAAVLMPFKIQRCTLQFWKIPVFFYVVPAYQNNSCNLNTRESVPKIATFITVYLLAVCNQVQLTVSKYWLVTILWQKWFSKMFLEKIASL